MSWGHGIASLGVSATGPIGGRRSIAAQMIERKHGGVPGALQHEMLLR
jgi:hypothetical protein